jgi:hypothetical protein
VAPSATPPLRRDAFVLFDDAVSLGSGEERVLGPYVLEQGDDLSVTAQGGDRFYLGAFDESTYTRLRREGGTAFPFQFGRDQVAFDFTQRVRVASGYYIVVRLGIFTKPTLIGLRVVQTKPAGAAR